MFQLSQYPVEQISQNFQKKFNGFKERSIPLEIRIKGAINNLIVWENSFQ